MRLLSLFLFFIFLPLIHAQVSFTPAEMEALGFHKPNLTVQKALSPSDDIVFWSNESEFAYRIKTETNRIDDNTRVVDYKYINDTFSVLIESLINQPVKISSPFLPGSFRFTLKEGLNNLVVPTRPYYGLHLNGVHTVAGDLFIKYRVDPFAMPDYPLVITYSEFTDALWENSFWAVFVLAAGFFFAYNLRKKAPFGFLSRVTLAVAVLFSLLFVAHYGYYYHEEETKESVVNEDGKVITLARQIEYYDFRLGKKWKEYARYLFIFPLLFGWRLGITAYPANFLRFLLFRNVDDFEVVNFEGFERGGFFRDFRGRTVGLLFKNEILPAGNLNGVGKLNVVTNCEVADAYSYPSSPFNRYVLLGLSVFFAAFFVLSPRLSLRVHPFYLGLIWMAVVLFLYRMQLQRWLGLLPELKYSIDSSALATLDSVTKAAYERSLASLYDVHRKAIQLLAEKDVKADLESMKFILGVDDIAAALEAKFLLQETKREEKKEEVKEKKEEEVESGAGSVKPGETGINKQP